MSFTSTSIPSLTNTIVVRSAFWHKLHDEKIHPIGCKSDNNKNSPNYFPCVSELWSSEQNARSHRTSDESKQTNLFQRALHPTKNTNHGGGITKIECSSNILVPNSISLDSPRPCSKGKEIMSYLGDHVLSWRTRLNHL